MNVTALSAPAATSNWKRVGWILLLLGGVFAAGNAVMFMLVDGHGVSRHQGPVLRHGASPGGGMRLAVRSRRLIGPFQLITRLRTSWPRVHVWMGRTYLLAVLAGGLGGLYFAPMSTAGIVGSVGFTTLAVFWLYSGAQAYLAIRRGKVQVHRRWMLRNYALTFGAATLRIELPLLLIAGVTFPAAYTIGRMDLVGAELARCRGMAAQGQGAAAMTKDEILAFVPPAAKMLGREVVEIDQVNGGAVLRFRALPEFLNRHGTVQGGLLCAMLDSATALALYAVLPRESTGLTANLNVSFLKPAKLGTFTATSRLVTRDERNAETAGELRDADGVLVATATARLRIVPRKD